MDLARATGMADPAPLFLGVWERAVSNDPALGDGRWIWENLVIPRRETTRTLAVQALLTLAAEDRLPGPGRAETASWPAVSVTAALGEARDGVGQGRLSVAWTLESGREDYGLELSPAGGGLDPYGGRGRLFSGDGAVLDVFALDGEGLAWNKRQAVADAFAGRAETRLWEESLVLAGAGIRLIPEIQEAQTTLNLAPFVGGTVSGASLRAPSARSLRRGGPRSWTRFLRAAGNGKRPDQAWSGGCSTSFWPGCRSRPRTSRPCPGRGPWPGRGLRSGLVGGAELLWELASGPGGGPGPGRPAVFAPA
jgi:hypothetical protein